MTATRSARSTSSATGPASARSAAPLGVTAFGVNGVVYPPGYPGISHYHDTQDELYFVHSGTAKVEVDGEERILGPGGLFHVESTTPRRIANVGDDELVLLVIGGKDGYVERDGHVMSDEDLERRHEPRKGAVVKGLMMDFQLTLPTILKRAETYFPHQEIVTRMPDRSFHRYTFADFGQRARQLAVGAEGARARAAATASRRSAGTTTSTSRPTSGSPAAASSCTRSTCACTRTTSATSPRTRATRP